MFLLFLMASTGEQIGVDQLIDAVVLDIHIGRCFEVDVDVKMEQSYQ